jgi:ABC-2 type transport system permease protein
MKLKPATWPWLLRHELKLAWGQAGGIGKWLLIGIGIVLWVVLHGTIWLIFANGSAKFGFALPPKVFALLGAMLWFVISLMLAQAIMGAVRALFERGDLDLLLASPMPPRTVLVVRGVGIAFTTISLYLFIFVPFAHVGLFTGRAHLMAIYPALIAIGLFVSAVGILLTLTLVRLMGARRARVAAQLLGALVGAIMFLLSQFQNMLGEKTRAAFAASISRAMEPGNMLAADSALWFPLRALLGEPIPLIVTCVLGFGLFGVVVKLMTRRFLEGTQESVTGSASTRSVAMSAVEKGKFFRGGLLRNVLVKEWRMIMRDPHLISQTMLQVLYLLPLVFIVFRKGDNIWYAVPGGIMLAATLAGSIAWITVAAEDAPELVASSPVALSRIRLMKALAAMIPVWVLIAPMFLFLLVTKPIWGIVFGVCAACATLGAGLMQIWYPRKGDRKGMQKRGKSDPLIGFMEFFSAAGWAGVSAALLAGPLWALALTPVALALAVAGPALAWVMGRARRDGDALLV